ncbi:MAG: hypothetical protein AAFY17_12040, partial [Cyanobacteria bacterium J06642_11]
PLMLAAVANNTDEEQAKAAFLDAYVDPVNALKEFAKELILSNQEGRALRLPEGYVGDIQALATEENTIQVGGELYAVT